MVCLLLVGSKWEPMEKAVAQPQPQQTSVFAPMPAAGTPVVQLQVFVSEVASGQTLIRDLLDSHDTRRSITLTTRLGVRMVLPLRSRA
jgi:5-enolpyruvylshikimate-3-phosphate synthase